MKWGIIVNLFRKLSHFSKSLFEPLPKGYWDPMGPISGFRETLLDWFHLNLPQRNSKEKKVKSFAVIFCPSIFGIPGFLVIHKGQGISVEQYYLWVLTGWYIAQKKSYNKKVKLLEYETSIAMSIIGFHLLHLRLSQNTEQKLE